MRSRVRHKPFFLLLSSGLVSQVLSIASYAILAIVSNPEEVGKYSTAVSTSAITTAILSLGFGQAILGSDKERDALKTFGVYSAILITLLAAVLPMTFGRGSIWVILLPSKLHVLESLAPLTLLLSFVQAANLAIASLMQRIRKVKQISYIQVIGSTTFFAGMCSLGLLGQHGTALTLLGVCLISQSLQLMYGLTSLRKSEKWRDLKVDSSRELVSVARKQSKTILFGSPIPIVNTLAIESPQIIFTTLFGAGAAGMFALSTKALNMSLSAVTAATSKYYYAEVVESSDCEGKTRKTLRLLTRVIVPFASYVALTVPSILNLLRPGDWQDLSVYLAVLALPSALWAISQPFTCWYLLRKVPERQLYWNCWNLVARIVAIFVGFKLSPGVPVIGLIGFASVSFLAYIVKIYTTVRLSGLTISDVAREWLTGFASPLILLSFAICSRISSLIGGDVLSVLMLTLLLLGYYSVSIREFRVGKVLVDLQD